VLPIVIVGGGISGLATAYYLGKAGLPVRLIEKEPKLGGFLQTETIEGCTVELGPDSFINSKPWARELIEDLGIGDQIIGSNDHLRATYIWKHGRFVPMPEGLTLMAPARLGPILHTELLGWGSKIRMARDYLRRPKKRDGEDFSVAALVRRHYGDEVVDYLAEPLLAGVYGGDVNELSAASVLPKFVEWERKYGSLTRGAMKDAPNSSGPLFGTLKNGFGQLVDELVRQTKAEFIQGSVEKIEQGYRVRVSGEWIETSNLVVACKPELVLPNLFPPMTYSSCTVVALIYRRSDVAHPLNGFGFLVPKRERKSIAACTWVGTKFNHRVPEDRVLLRCFAGSTADVFAEMREKMGITAEPLARKDVPWPNSMPQYTVGHSDRIDLIEDMLKDLRGLHLVGNAYRGIGIPDCVRMAKQVAEKIIATCP
jgi:protoporphyrinogen/coproporphyrinogen III oxidase